MYERERAIERDSEREYMYEVHTCILICIPVYLFAYRVIVLVYFFLSFLVDENPI